MDPPIQHNACSIYDDTKTQSNKLMVTFVSHTPAQVLGCVAQILSHCDMYNKQLLVYMACSVNSMRKISMQYQYMQENITGFVFC